MRRRCAQTHDAPKWPPRLATWAGSAARPVAGTRRCGTWVILASGAFVCHNDDCWRVLANWYKEKDDAKKMDESAT